MRLFDRKTCFSVHGDHAFLVARHLYRSTSQVAAPREGGVPAVTVSLNLFPSLLRELLVERGEHAVEVYEGAGSSWRCARCALHASPRPRCPAAGPAVRFSPSPPSIVLL